jgi:hypothetical protein
LSFSTLDRHLKKRRWKRKRRPVSSAGRLVKVELAAKESPTHLAATCIIEKCLASDRIIIDTVISKYCNHTPLHRQSMILKKGHRLGY